jgi:hypothetical protein
MMNHIFVSILVRICIFKKYIFVLFRIRKFTEILGGKICDDITLGEGFTTCYVPPGITPSNNLEVNVDGGTVLNVPFDYRKWAYFNMGFGGGLCSNATNNR